MIHRYEKLTKYLSLPNIKSMIIPEPIIGSYSLYPWSSRFPENYHKAVEVLESLSRHMIKRKSSSSLSYSIGEQP